MSERQHNPSPSEAHTQSFPSPLKLVFSLLLGIYFGILLDKSQVISWFKIRKMFFFKEPDLYLIIGSAVVVGALSIFLLKRLHARDIEGIKIEIPKKPYTLGLFIGGILFGIGWFVTGTCPGPIFTQIGSGERFALFTLAGALLGTYAYGALRKQLPH
jgi:uncharacterized membrane protein YedE/YeeE